MQLKRARDALGVDRWLSLQRLMDSKYLQLCMNAQALKACIRQRLRDHKFELERLEWSYCNVLNGKFVSLLIRYTVSN